MKREREDKAVRLVETKETGPENCPEKILHRTRLGSVCPVCDTAIPFGPAGPSDYVKFFQVVAPASVATGEPVSDEETAALAAYEALMVEYGGLLTEKQSLDAKRVALMQPSVNFRGEVVYPPGTVSLDRIAALSERIEEVRDRAQKALVRWNAAGRRRMVRRSQAETDESSGPRGGLRGAIDALLRA